MRRSGIAQVFDLSLAVPATEAGRAKGLISSEDCKVLDLVPAGTAAVGAVVADEGSIAKQEEVRIGIEEGIAGIAAKAIKMPPVSSCRQKG